MPKAHCMVVARDPTTGATLLSATCNVYTPGTVTPIPVTIYDKNNNVLSNPLTSDPSTGLIDFYIAVAQEVDLVISKTGFTTRTYSNVPVLDDASLDLSALLTTTGDTPYASSANTPARLPIGAQGTFLNVGGGSVPRWGNTIDAGGLTVTAGNMGIGGAPSANIGVETVNLSLSGSATQVMFAGRGTGNSSATGEISAFYATPQTAAAAFTCTTVAGFHSVGATRGAGSTITNAYGLLVDAVTVGSTNNYGIYINTPSGASGENYAIRVTDTGVVRTGSLQISNDLAGSAGTVSFSNATAGPGANAPAFINAPSGVGGTQAAWLKARVGTSVIWIPYWS